MTIFGASMPMQGAARATLLCLCLLSAACTSSFSLNVPTSSSKAPTPSAEIPQTAELDQDNTRKLFLTLVEGLRKQGKSRAAVAYLYEYNKRYAKDPAAEMLLADCLLDIGTTDLPQSLYSGLVNGPNAAAAYAGLGRVAAARHDWAGAVTQFEQATRREATNPSYVNDLGFALVHVGAYDRGLATLQEATQLDPSSRVARNNLVLGTVLAGRADEAAELVAAIADPKERDQASQLLHVTTAANDVSHASPSQPE